MMYERIEPVLLIGQLVYISDNFKWTSPLDVPFSRKKKCLHETIRTDNFPSTNDYMGDFSIVNVGEPALIIDIKPRSLGKITFDEWNRIKNIPLGTLEVDVYTILINNTVREAFRVWLSHVPIR